MLKLNPAWAFCAPNVMPVATRPRSSIFFILIRFDAVFTAVFSKLKLLLIPDFQDVLRLWG